MSRQLRYAEALKQEVVLQIASGKLSKERARLQYKIGGKVTIGRWLYNYGYQT
ncbi:MAG: DNA-binding protein [Rickettsiales bacterium]|nr:DNA-binding protein [Rickettsiales bacterium]